MKKLLWFLCTVLLLGNLFAQDQKSETLKMQWDGTDWQNLSKIEYSYPGDNERIETHYIWESEAWVPSLRISYTMNEQGGPVTMLMEMNSGAGWILLSTSTMEYTYSNGQVTEIIYLVSGAISSRETYSYSDDHLSEVLGQMWNGSGWDDSYRNTYTYSSDNLTQTVMENWDGGAWVFWIRSNFFYSGSQQTGYETQEYIAADWVKIAKCIYSYNVNNIIEELHQEWNGSSWADMQKWFHTYGQTSINEPITSIPTDFGLSNYPNPFNPETNIQFELPQAQVVSLTIYDITGRVINKLIRNEKRNAGLNVVVWNGLDRHNIPVPSGIYYYHLKTSAYSMAKRCVLQK